MATQREFIGIPGVLKGKGVEVTCIVWTTRMSLPGSSAVMCVPESIGDVSTDLPDGSYEVRFNEQTKRGVHFRGKFLFTKT